MPQRKAKLLPADCFTVAVFLFVIGGIAFVFACSFGWGDVTPYRDADTPLYIAIGCTGAALLLVLIGGTWDVIRRWRQKRD